MPTYIFDDVYGDQRTGSKSPQPAYKPAWAAWDPVGGTCWGCTLGTNIPIPIDPRYAIMGTWHMTTVSPGDPATNVSINFIGTSISAYCILPPNITSPAINYTFLSFILDGAKVGSFEWTGTTMQWTYNYLVFSRQNLTQREHTFIISPQSQDKKQSFLALDYFTYDLEENNTTVSSNPLQASRTTLHPLPSNISSCGHIDASTSAAIGGSVVGSAALLCFMALFGIWYARKHRINLRQYTVSPFNVFNPGATFEQPMREVRPVADPTEIRSSFTQDARRTPSVSVRRNTQLPQLITAIEHSARPSRRIELGLKRAAQEASQEAERLRPRRDSSGYVRGGGGEIHTILSPGAHQHHTAGTHTTLPPSYHASLA